MVSTGLRGTIARFRQQHSQPLALFGLSLGLLVAGDWHMRRAMAGLAAAEGEVILAALSQGRGLLGLALVLGALLLWALLLARWQLSFFYPLWGLGAVGAVLLRWAWLDAALAPPALLGVALVCGGALLLMRGGHSV